MKSAETIFFLEHDISDNQASGRETRTHVIIAKYHRQHFFRGIFHERSSPPFYQFIVPPPLSTHRTSGICGVHISMISKRLERILMKLYLQHS